MATNPTRIRIASGAALLVLGVALAGCGGSSSNGGSASAGVKRHAASVGQAAPEVARQRQRVARPQLRPLELARDDATYDRLADVAKLKMKWRFNFPGSGAFGNFAFDSVVLGGDVYLQDLNSNVYALDRRPASSSGGTLRHHRASGRTASPRVRPPLRRHREQRVRPHPATGALLWKQQADPRTTRASTWRPSSTTTRSSSPRSPGAAQVLLPGRRARHRLGARRRHRQDKWKFDTIPTAEAFGQPRSTAAAGSGTRPRSTPRRRLPGRRQPGLWPNTPKYPNGASRPGPNLYTDSLVALNGQTGKLMWFRQVIPTTCATTT